MTTDSEFSHSDIVVARTALAEFHAAYGAFVNASGIVPLEGSRAKAEEAEYADPGSIRTAYAQALQLIEVAADQLTAFLKTITEPVETLAPWSCVRAMLEACAIAIWLLDPEIGAHQRAGRSMALRYAGLRELQKYIKTCGHPTNEQEDRLRELEMHAANLGFEPIKNRKSKVQGAGAPFPPMTELIQTSLGDESVYRLLSGVAHGHYWATSQLGFNILPPDAVQVPDGYAAAATKAVNPLGMVYLAHRSARALAKTAWLQCIYCGWDEVQSKVIRDALFASLRQTRKTTS